MKVSRLWLSKFFDNELPVAQEIADALTFHAFEIESIEKVGGLRQGDEASDDVLDVKITPNRGHDSLSHRGVAKELSAILKIPLAHDPLKDVLDLSKVTDMVSVSIEDEDLCNRYCAALVKGIKVTPSPSWLKERLESIGQRSINNVVDATNFVMFNIGQPLHAFDAGQLQFKNGSYAIEVKKTKANEKIRTLDGKEYILSDSMMVISDANADVSIGIAGVKGGEKSQVHDGTVDIIIESANFNNVSVRKTAQTLKLRTDASVRFEQNLSPEFVPFAIESVVGLILKIAGGELVGYKDVYLKIQELKEVSVTTKEVVSLLGGSFNEKNIIDTFERLGFSYTQKEDVFTVRPPFERLDILIPEDLIEEVGRIVGYENIPAKNLPLFERKPQINQNFEASEQVRKNLTALGYSEVYTSVFADTGERSVLNKVDSVRPYLRDSLTPGLNEAWTLNSFNKDLLGLKEIKLFEIGTVWKDGKEITMAGIVEGKEGAKEDPLSMYIKETADYEDMPVSQNIKYKPFSKYPFVTRDIALWVPEGTGADMVKEIILKEAGALLMRIDLFDEFKKEDKVSYAFRLIFQSFEKTLTDQEVGEIMNKINIFLKDKGFEVR